MKIIITGVGGQLGYEVISELVKRGHYCVGCDLHGLEKPFFECVNLDITNEEQVNAVVESVKPDAVIHCAAWTSVDSAEQNEDEVYKVNALGTSYLAKASYKIGAKIIYISTDYVFDGKGSEPFEVCDPKNPLSVYGKTKSIGEDFVIQNNPMHFIVRTTGVFAKNGNNFINTMLKFAKSGKREINVVNDQIVSVTYAKDLAILLGDMVETQKFGIYHAVNDGFISWCDFAREIFKEAKLDVKVNAVSTEQYRQLVPGQAIRPKNSRLSTKSLSDAGFNKLPSYLSALKRYLKDDGE